MLNRTVILLCFGILGNAYAYRPKLEANRGQFEHDVLYVARTSGVDAAITADGLSLRYDKESLTVRFERARRLQCRSSSSQEGVANYPLLDPAVTGAPQYGAVTCDRIYPGIDWIVRTVSDSLEHDWHIAPGANPADIRMVLPSNATARLTDDHALRLQSGALVVDWKKPVAWQELNGQRIAVSVDYGIEGHRISLQVGEYRRDLALVIDPVIDLSVMIGGTGSERGYQVGVDASGNIYVAGLTTSSNFQTTAGALHPKRTSPTITYQAFVRKITPDGSGLIYSTFLSEVGSSSNHPLGMRVDSIGNVYLAGFGLESSDSTRAGVVKLAPDGSRLIYTTKVSAKGNSLDPVALAIDSSGAAYVASGSTTLIVSKINPSGSAEVFSYSTKPGDYSGGIAGIETGSDGSIYVAGYTGNMSLATTEGALKTSIVNPQNSHGYLIRLKPDGSGPIFSTYIGGDNTDLITALSLDSAGNAYVGGQTTSSDKFPGLQGALLGLTAASANTAFVIKVNPAGNKSIYTALVPGTLIAALAVDEKGNAWAAGPFAATTDIASTTIGVNVLKINADGTGLAHRLGIPFPGGFGYSDFVGGMTLDQSGSAYLTGSSNSVRMPETSAVWQSASNAYVLKINANPDQCDLAVDIYTDQSVFSPGAQVDFRLTLKNNGAAAADNVVLQAPYSGGELSSCRATGTGICSPVRVVFPSIAPGASETVLLSILPSLIPRGPVQIAAVVSTSTAENNLANNAASAVSTPNGVPINVTSLIGSSTLNIPYTIGGDAAIYSSPSSLAPSYALPGGQIVVTLPSPTLSGTAGSSYTFKNWSDGNTDNPRTFTVPASGLSLRANFQFLYPPYLTAGGLTSAASYVSGGVSPGELVTVFGFNLGSKATAQILNGSFTTSIGGSRILFDGVPAPLIYTGGQQSAAVVPYEVAGKATTTVTVEFSNQTGTVQVPVLEAVPALFTANATGSGQASALNTDGTVNSPANPAKIGEVIVLYGTGEGLENPRPANGSITGAQLPAPSLGISVTIGGKAAEILYAGPAPSLVAGVIQINARIPEGIQESHHVPVTWSAGNHSSQEGVTIAVGQNPVSAIDPAPTTTGQLPQIRTSPSRIAADSDAVTVTVSGSGFEAGYVVKWNGHVLPTSFLDSSRLQAIVSADYLTTPSLGYVSVWGTAGNTRVSEDAAVLVYLAVQNNDLVYDKLRGKIYVAVSSQEKGHGPSIAVLNPETGRIESWFPLDAEPNKLAVSDDSRYLYVGFTGKARRIDLTSWAINLDIPFTPCPDCIVFSMIPLPGAGASLAVSFTRNGLSPPYAGTAIFDGAQLRPKVTPGHDGPGYLLGGPDTSTVYGTDEQGKFYALRLDTSGATVTSTVEGIIGLDANSVYSGGKVYGGGGSVIDPSIPDAVRAFDAKGLIRPMPETGKTIILATGYGSPLTQSQLLLLDDATDKRLWTQTFARQTTLTPASLIHWGTNGVAFRELPANSQTAPLIQLFRIPM